MNNFTQYTYGIYKSLFLFISTKTKLSFDDISLIQIMGGLSNNNYKIIYRGVAFFIRVCNSDNFLCESIDRSFELMILEKSSLYDLTVKPVFFDINSGTMITPFIDGKMPMENAFYSSDFMNNFVYKLKLLHNQNTYKYFNPFIEIKNKYAKCLELDLLLPPSIDRLIKKVENLEVTLIKNQTIGLCHNDLNPSNIIIYNDDILFIDFEYAMMGDIFWDLATISWLIDDNSRFALINSYFGYCDSYSYKKLLDYLFLVKLNNALWSLLKSHFSNCDYDYFNASKIIFDELLT